MRSFRILKQTEYKSFFYEADSNDRVCIFDKYIHYLVAVDTIEQANQYVDALLEDEAKAEGNE